MKMTREKYNLLFTTLTNLAYPKKYILYTVDI